RGDLHVAIVQHAVEATPVGEGAARIQCGQCNEWNGKSEQPTHDEPHDASNAARTQSQSARCASPSNATTSKRQGNAASAGCACRNACAARVMRSRLAVPTEAAPPPKSRWRR